MPTLSIKDVPETWAAALRARAALNHRSLQGELMAIIEQAAAETSSRTRDGNSFGEASKEALASQEKNANGRRSTRRGRKTIEQIHAEHLTRFPKPITQGPRSVDLIRQDRDKR